LISTPAYEPVIDEPVVDESYADVERDADATQPVTDSDPVYISTHRIEPVLDEQPVVIDVDDEPTISPDEAPASPAPAEPVVRTEPVSARTEPVVAPTETVVARTEPVIAPEPAPAPAASVEAPPPKRPRARTPRKIVVLRLAAGPHRIAGDALRQAFAAQGLVHGKYQIFHYHHSDGSTLFSVASMVEPGSFDLAHMDTSSYPGVTLFAQLPCNVPGLDVLEELLRNAKLLQSAVGGTLQDERGALLNSPRIQRLRQEVIDFEHLCDAQTDDTAASLTSS
jgi:cell division protein ZipA